VTGVEATSAAGVIVACNEEITIARTVKSLLALEPIRTVTVIDGHSDDRTAEEAAGAGADVIPVGRAGGKGRALEEAFDLLPDANVYLLVDGDVGDTASGAGALLDAVLRGDLDVAVGRLPVQEGGGFGLVKSLARMAIRRLTAFDPSEPLSGQRAARREALEACRPFAHGFGLETAMTVDAARLGFRIGEMPVAMTHRATGRGMGGFMHRGRQGLDILAAVAPRLARIR
jgi:glycosyltransferase involved in cell wall biosynthesis